VQSVNSFLSQYVQALRAPGSGPHVGEIELSRFAVRHQQLSVGL
jgi:hypothetical protein